MSDEGKAFARPYLDADAWIHALSGTETGNEVIRPILTAVDAGTMNLVVSAMMPLELLGGTSNSRTKDAEEDALAALSRPNVIEVPVGRALVIEARKLRLQYGLASMDAVHLASAVRGRADVYMTYDDKALKVSQVGQTRICKPYWFGDVPIPGLGL
ncbi:MAG: type II toxin-antitoxin system VapC family toxin [Mycobacteriales bacterium]